MTPDFCTYFDCGYLPRALALHESIRRYSPGSRLFAVCMDEDSFDILSRLALADLVPIRRADFERGDDALVATSRTRSVVEYYFTCTPSITLFVMKAHADISVLFYVDADMFFMGDVSEMLADMGDASIYIVEHRFPPDLESSLQYGRFNVGVLGFRNDEKAIACLTRWREQCIEWCYDRLEGERFADQKYLDEWPSKYEDVQVSTHKGVNIAPWNKGGASIRTVSGQVLVNGESLICYHFHGLRFLNQSLVEPHADDYGSILTNDWLRLVYAPYIHKVLAFAEVTKTTATAKRMVKPPDNGRLSQNRDTRRYLVRCGPFLVPLNGWKMDLFVSWSRLYSLPSRLVTKLKWRRSV